MARSTVRGTSALKRRLESVISESKMREAITSSCQQAAGEAQAMYAPFVELHPGGGSVSVRAEDGRGAQAMVKASGPSVLFIEYGSGVNGMAYGRNAAKHGFTPGSYSATHADAIIKSGPYKGWWRYRGSVGGGYGTRESKSRPGTWWTQGNDGANVMAQTADRLRKSVVRNIKRKMRP